MVKDDRIVGVVKICKRVTYVGGRDYMWSEYSGHEIKDGERGSL